MSLKALLCTIAVTSALIGGGVWLYFSGLPKSDETQVDSASLDGESTKGQDVAVVRKFALSLQVMAPEQKSKLVGISEVASESSIEKEDVHSLSHLAKNTHNAFKRTEFVELISEHPDEALLELKRMLEDPAQKKAAIEGLTVWIKFMPNAEVTTLAEKYADSLASDSSDEELKAAAQLALKEVKDIREPPMGILEKIEAGLLVPEPAPKMVRVPASLRPPTLGQKVNHLGAPDIENLVGEAQPN